MIVPCLRTRHRAAAAASLCGAQPNQVPSPGDATDQSSSACSGRIKSGHTMPIPLQYNIVVDYLLVVIQPECDRNVDVSSNDSGGAPLRLQPGGQLGAAVCGGTVWRHLRAHRRGQRHQRRNSPVGPLALRAPALAWACSCEGMHERCAHAPRPCTHAPCTWLHGHSAQPLLVTPLAHAPLASRHVRFRRLLETRCLPCCALRRPPLQVLQPVTDVAKAASLHGWSCRGGAVSIGYPLQEHLRAVQRAGGGVSLGAHAVLAAAHAGRLLPGAPLRSTGMSPPPPPPPTHTHTPNNPHHHPWTVDGSSEVLAAATDAHQHI